MRVMVVEDGHEYSEAFNRFVPEVEWVRVDSGAQAAVAAEKEAFDAIFMDMCFDRVPIEALLGDWEVTTDQFNGDRARARAHLQDHQGLFIIDALRRADIRLPIVVSWDFSAEPKRWERMTSRYRPIDFVRDADGPRAIEARVRALV